MIIYENFFLNLEFYGLRLCIIAHNNNLTMFYNDMILIFFVILIYESR